MTVLAVAVNPVPAAGADANATDPAAIAVIAATIDGDTLQLADGRVLRLAAIMAPKDSESLAAAARAALATAVGRQLRLEFGARQTDRHGRLLAQAWLSTADGTKEVWLQEMLLAQGFARVASTGDTRTLVPALLRIEAQARSAGRGLWADPAYRVRTPADAGDVVNSFQIVEGRVLTAARVHGGGYLNFGADYKTDFTLSFDGEALQRLQESGIDFKSLEGVRLRARGWLRYFNGPLIDITHPEQIEVLE
ncbi:MAG TPA: thermonuclease family protein [Candidatus Angelobacter sp.]|nr:thermonuclease family protein [Candidatus Angelobacter sp.]